MPLTDSTLSELLSQARCGNRAAQDQLLSQYRSYVALLARLQIKRRFRGRIDSSDIVQEVLLRAHQAFLGFRGTTESEFLAWLRRILATRLVDAARFHGRAVRGHLRLEAELDRELMDLSSGFGRVVATNSSPSQSADRREQCGRVASALESLPSTYRDVLILRYFEVLSLADAAKRLGRSSEAVRKIEARAIVRLRDWFGRSP